MKQPIAIRFILGFTLVLTCLLATRPAAQAQPNPKNGETIVLIRHGEKPPAGLGQLNCKGLNRSLALPSLLIGRFGKPDYIFAPNPSVLLRDGSNQPTFSYVRPLATIEPTAIRLEMPVNTQIGFDQIDELRRVLLQPMYAHSLIFVAWEHLKLHDFAQMMLQLYGSTPVKVPDWPNDDYGTIYVFHITRPGSDATPVATLDIQQENLGGSLSDTCPGSK